MFCAGKRCASKFLPSRIHALGKIPVGYPRDRYLQVGGGDKGGEAKVQIELTPNVKVESEIGQDARAGGGLFWEWEY